MRVALLVVCPALLFGSEGPAERIRTAMQPSLEKQKASVQRQLLKAQTAGFFATDWPAPVAGVSGASDCDPLAASDLEPLIEGSAQRYGVEAALVRAVIRKESAGRPCAVSAKGALGLMQLMPATAEQLAVANPFDPQSNVDGGTRFLKSLLEKYKGELPLVLGAYNAGPAAVDREGAVPKIPETQDYVAEILKALRRGGGP